LGAKGWTVWTEKVKQKRSIKMNKDKAEETGKEYVERMIRKARRDN